MQSIELKQVTVLGMLAHRILRNSMRLESGKYQPDRVYQAENCEWPADWEGRVLLAQTRILEDSHREPSFMREIFEGVYARFNKKGYLGPILPDGEFNEQQLSGHNWLLRALLEYRRLTGDKAAENAAYTIVRNLYLPLRGGAYARYAVQPEKRVFQGNPDGCLTGDCVDGWYLSTDIGCAYMCLDGLSAAYRDLDIPELKGLLEEMIEEFGKIDFVGLSMQTHATLSGIRGILNFYRSTGEGKYLELAKRLFHLYLSEGMSENYGNYNWFQRPLWTEPCAIVDSYMAAMELYRITEEIPYFEVAQKIYLNALGHAQRINGGFGCDNCVGAESPFLTVHGNGVDAFWCCSMRGGEGLAEVCRSIALEKDGILHIGFYNPCEIRWKDAVVTLKTGYPAQGSVELKVVGSMEKLGLFLPSYAQTAKVTVNGVETACEKKNGFLLVPLGGGDCQVTLDFSIPLLEEKVINKNSLQGYHSFSHGFLMLGVESQSEHQLAGELLHDEGACYHAGELKFRPLDDTYRINLKDLKDRKLQVLFRR